MQILFIFLQSSLSYLPLYEAVILKHHSGKECCQIFYMMALVLIKSYNPNFYSHNYINDSIL